VAALAGGALPADFWGVTGRIAAADVRKFLAAQPWEMACRPQITC
jgi:hypothetical protein